MITFDLMSNDNHILKYNVNDDVDNYIIEFDEINLKINYLDSETPTDIKYWVEKSLKSIQNKVQHFYIAFG